MLVRAINRGYIGGIIREPGEEFDFPDAAWADKQRRPSWVEPADASDADEDEPDAKPARRRGRPPKAKDDEPAGSGVAEALGTDPDWLPPGADDSDDAADSK